MLIFGTDRKFSFSPSDYTITDTSLWSTDILEAYVCRWFLQETLWSN